MDILKKKHVGKLAGLFLVSALLFGACGQGDEVDNASGAPAGSGSLAQGGTVSFPEGEPTRLPKPTGAAEGSSGQADPGVTPTEAAAGNKGQANPDAMPAVPPDGLVPVEEAYFPDPAFREYLLAYVDRDSDQKLSEEERGMIEGLGSVSYEGGLSNGSFPGSNVAGSNLKRGEMLRAIESLAGIHYFPNLKEIYFAGGYELKVLPIDNPKLERVRLDIHTLEELTIRDAPKLRTLVYAICGRQDIAWEKFPELVGVSICDAELAMEDLAKCTKLDFLSLSGCTVTMPEDPGDFAFPCLTVMELTGCDIKLPQGFGALSFSNIPKLKKFCCFEAKDQDAMLAKELDFGENEYLEEVSLGAVKMAEKIIFASMDTNFKTEAEWEGCEVVFMPETTLDRTKPLPEGDIWLTAENFPDAVFRQYLYHFVDQDKDHILSKNERSNIRVMDARDVNPALPVLQQRRANNLLNAVYCFEGIKYLEDLREFCLGGGSVANSLHFDNPSLLDIRLPEGLTEFSIQHPDNLQTLHFESRWGLELDLSQMQSLRKIYVTNVAADFSCLTQNKYLEEIRLEDCISLRGVKEYDFSGLVNLQSVTIIPKEGQPLWAEYMHFPDTGIYSRDPLNWDWIKLGKNVAKQVILEGKNIHCRAEGSEVIYLDDTPGEDVVLGEDSIWNGTEYIADANFRCYLYSVLDKERDNVLTRQEREELTCFVDTGYNYDYAPDDEVNQFQWKVEDDFSPYVYGITSLRGFEHFPKLYRLQLKEMELSGEEREIVISNPELEILDLRFNGNVETIDLTACKKLRVCVIDSTRDAEFVQEIAPTILLPEHLEFSTVEGMDCMIR